MFTTNGRAPLSGVGVRVRKNGQEYSPPKEALTNAEGKAVFTDLGLNGTSDTVDITANGAELINTTLARVNASLVTLRMSSNPVFGGRVSGSAAYEPTSRRLVVTGGQDSTNTGSLFYAACHNDVIEAMNVAQKSFRTRVPGGLTTSPAPRQDAAMAAADGVAVFFGGRDCVDTGDSLGDTWEFNLATHAWARVSPATGPSPRRAPAMLREPSGTSALMVGGFRDPSYSNEMWRYTPATDTWEMIGTAPFSRAFMGAATNTTTGELWFCGGRAPFTAECQAYNPTAGSWSVKPSLPSVRSDLAMAFDPNSGNFVEHSRVPVNGTLKSVAAVDLNQDGRNDLAVASQSANSVYLLPGTRPLQTSAGQTFSFTAPSESGVMQVFHGIHGYRRYWEYSSPIQPGPVSYSLPLPSTLAPSSAPVAPASGQVTLSWTPWVRKWSARASRGPFNPRDFYWANLGSDSDTQPGAHLYQWP